MQRIRAAAALLMSLGLAVGTVTPVLAEPTPPSLTIETSVSHYLGGWWEQWVTFNVTCDGFAPQQVTVDLPGASDDVLPLLGAVPVGTYCWIEIGEWSDPGENADWETESYTPDWWLTLQEGDNRIHMDLRRIWAAEWPPQDDTGEERAMEVTVDRVYLNGRGGIEVEGTTLCPDAADVFADDPGGMLFANAQWTALQYVGRKGSIGAGYESGIAHPCFDAGDPAHGPYAWQTRYPYPDGRLQYVYSPGGKFGSGWIHVDAFSQSETVLMTQSFAPGGWTSYEGEYVPYDVDGVDENGDGWTVTHVYWYGWGQADLKPIRVR